MSTTMFFLLFIPLLALILLAINLIFAPHNPYQEKDSAFECGFHSFLGQNRTQFSISFFVFALLFLLFDLEILLVYPYIVSAYTNDIYGLVIMLLFFLLLTLGFAFELGKNALKIDSRQVSTLTSYNSTVIKSIFVSSFFSYIKKINLSRIIKNFFATSTSVVIKHVKTTWQIYLTGGFISITFKPYVSFFIISMGLLNPTNSIMFGLIFALIRLVKDCYKHDVHNFAYKTFLLHIVIGTSIAQICSLIGCLGFSFFFILPAMFGDYLTFSRPNVNIYELANKPNLRLFAAWSPIEGNTSGISSTNNPTSDTGIVNDNNTADIKSKISKIMQQLNDVVRIKTYYLNCLECNNNRLKGIKTTVTLDDYHDARDTSPESKKWTDLAKKKIEHESDMEISYVKLQVDMRRHGYDATQTNNPKILEGLINNMIDNQHRELESLFREKKRLQDSLLDIKKVDSKGDNAN